jgi:hypothetical protein
LKNKLTVISKKLNAIQPVLRALAVTLILSIQIITFIGFSHSSFAEAEAITDAKGLNLEINHGILIPKPIASEIAEANKNKPIIEEQERKALERDGKISRLVNFLKKQHSPIATNDYAAQIIDVSEKNGADYRLIVGIMGVESGFCIAPYRMNGNTYNCFGYLNKVKYSSYTAAFNDLIPKISKQYVKKYGWNLEAFSKAYGEKNWEKCSAEIRAYANAL